MSKTNTNQIGQMIFPGYGTYTFSIETFADSIRINKTSGYGRGGEIYIVWVVE
jgi:hypothetical protein